MDDCFYALFGVGLVFMKQNMVGETGARRQIIIAASIS